VYLRRMRSLWTSLLGAQTVVVEGPPTCVFVCVYTYIHSTVMTDSSEWVNPSTPVHARA
jgi:hypothetical protein